jgi:hypothetical protein
VAAAAITRALWVALALMQAVMAAAVALAAQPLAAVLLGRLAWLLAA